MGIEAHVAREFDLRSWRSGEFKYVRRGGQLVRVGRALNPQPPLRQPWAVAIRKRLKQVEGWHYMQFTRAEEEAITWYVATGCISPDFPQHYREAISGPLRQPKEAS